MARRPVCSPTGRPQTLAPARPNAGTAALYTRRLHRLVEEMHASVVYWITAAYRADPPELATDAAPADRLRKAMRGLAKRWTDRFNAAAPKLAAWFATAAHARSDATLGKVLRDGGITVRFTMSPQVNDVLKATLSEQVNLIKSIPAQYLTQVEGMVMRSVQAGRDINALTNDLQQTYGVTRRRAAFIAKDQNNKATSTITRARYLELGIEEAIWLHSAGGRVPRPEHVAFSGRKYDVRQGAFLEGKWTFPGWEINCRCVAKPVLPI